MSDEEIEVPDDAGEYADGLAAILRRFEDGWPDWIEPDAGWYPLITELDADLAAIAPDYVIQQVKEKFGGLRYYAEVQPLSADEYVDPGIRERFERLIREAEARSMATCERCGGEGMLCRAGSWYKTLCSGCREALSVTGRQRFEPVGEGER